MTNCPQCGVPAVDGSRFCKECGCRLAPVATCPQCGAPLAGGAAFCEQCGCNLAAAQATPAQVSQPPTGSAAVSSQAPIQPPHPQVAQPAPQLNPGNPQPAKSGDNSSGKTVLIAVLVALILLLLGGAGWAVYTGKLNLEGNSLANRSETETETSNATSAENDNTLDVTSEAASDDEPETTDETPEPAEAAPSTPAVYMSMWGTIGDSEEVDFEMSGTSGWYSYKRKGVTGPKRTLKLKSFDSMSRRCVIDAFLNGKYIGHFDGKFIDDEVDIGDGDTKSVQSYDGAFISDKGLKIDFYLYCD